ncbi:MAG: cation transporter, partial [Anaerolineales bacterium]|nr:cation transporter [Anaerolineales bacterium]
IINGFGAYRLHRNETLNARVAGWHLLEDVLGWTAVLVVSIILLFTDWYILDPLLSILITTYILISVISRLRQTVRLFLQAAPENVQLQDIRQTILQLEQVQNIHHMHLWSLDGDHHVLTAHVVVPPETTKKAASRLKRQLAHKIKLDNFEHVTIEIEYGQDDCRLPDVDASPKLA